MPGLRLPIRGRVEYAVKNPDGKLVAEGKGSNLVTTVGKEWMGDLITGLSVVTDLDTGGEIRFGTSGAAALESQEAFSGANIPNMDPAGSLVVSISKPGVLTPPEISIADDGTGIVNNNVGKQTVGEMGIFLSAASTPSNLMIARFIPQVFDVEPGGEIFVTWTLEIG